MKLSRLLLPVTGIIVLTALLANAQSPPARVEPATFTFQNREIITLRSMRGDVAPRDRVAGAARRLRDELRAFGPGELTVAKIDGVTAILMRTNPIIMVLPGDVDPELVGQSATVDATAEAAAARLSIAVRAWSDERNPSVIIRGLLYSMLALVLAAAAIWLIARSRVAASTKLAEKAKHRVEGRATVKEINILDPLLKLLQFSLGLIRILLLAAVTYLWLTYTFSQFPFTAPWASRLAGFLADSISTVLVGIVGGIPTMFLAILILAVTRLFAYTVKILFDSVVNGRVQVKGIYPDTAHAMRRISVVLVWVFGIALAFPFIPGSNSDAVKGVSVLFGLMITLGSSGIISQGMSGLVVVFSRAIREDEYVTIGEYEGTITQVGALSAKMRTLLNEEITIPNSVLVSTPTRNYSRLGRNDGVVLQARVGIGYDAPWRQVHGMLIEAAGRTTGLRQTPSPFVRQANLSNFYVEYTINAYLEQPEKRLVVLSDLHANIQDVFNEHEIQIMTPAFESQPSEPVLVPRKPDKNASV
jgi:small-conductance mechanosensitive channel